MTAAAYATNLTTFWLEGAANAIVSIGTGGAGTPDPETDFFIQGTDCQSKGAWANAIKGFILDNDGNEVEFKDRLGTLPLFTRRV